jgi:hypothetical protein
MFDRRCVVCPGQVCVKSRPGGFRSLFLPQAVNYHKPTRLKLKPRACTWSVEETGRRDGFSQRPLLGQFTAINTNNNIRSNGFVKGILSHVRADDAAAT